MACQVWHKDYAVMGMEQQSLFQYISVADTLKQGQLLCRPMNEHLRYFVTG